VLCKALGHCLHTGHLMQNAHVFKAARYKTATNAPVSPAVEVTVDEDHNLAAKKLVTIYQARLKVRRPTRAVLPTWYDSSRLRKMKWQRIPDDAALRKASPRIIEQQTPRGPALFVYPTPRIARRLSHHRPCDSSRTPGFMRATSIFAGIFRIQPQLRAGDACYSTVIGSAV